MTDGIRNQMLAGLKVTSLGTLLSRVLGMVRDMATAALFGLSGDGVMDAMVVAFRIPNLFRRLFGEGALTACYLPVLSRELERDRTAGWRLATATFAALSVVLLVTVIVGEGLLAMIYLVAGERPGMSLLLGLAAVLLPYMIFICLAAQLAATLHALAHFSIPALAPVVLNIGWLIGVWGLAPWLTSDKQVQAYILAVCVSLTGIVQMAMHIPPLRQAGFRFQLDWPATAAPLRQVGRAVLPTVLGLAITQLNTLVDSLLAWGLARSPETGETIPWLPGAIRYPVDQGAAAAVYYGERLYQFPLGIVGVTVATVIFPLLSRHAARGERDRLAVDLTLGLRLVSFLAIPASVGLVLLASPIARLLFERGEFTADDARRTANMIAWYGAGVWAFCALPVLVRGFYCVGNYRAPVRVGGVMVALNLLLNVVLLWPLGEIALAVGTSAAATVQVVILTRLFTRETGRLDWPALRRTLGQTTLATLVMSGICWVAMRYFPAGESTRSQLLAVAVPSVAAGAVFSATAWRMRSAELSVLLARGERLAT